MCSSLLPIKQQNTYSTIKMGTFFAKRGHLGRSSELQRIVWGLDRVRVLHGMVKVGVGSWGMYHVNESPHKNTNVRMCVCTHSQQAIFVFLGTVQSVLQGHPVLLGQFLQSPSLTLRHLPCLLFGLSSHMAHFLFVGGLFLAQGLTKAEGR